MRTQTRRQGFLTSKRQKAIWCQPESAMSCAHLSHFGYAVQLLLQVSNAVMGASDPPNALTRQSAPPQEMNEGYGLPEGGRPDL